MTIRAKRFPYSGPNPEVLPYSRSPISEMNKAADSWEMGMWAAMPKAAKKTTTSVTDAQAQAESRAETDPGPEEKHISAGSQSMWGARRAR